VICRMEIRTGNDVDNPNLRTDDVILILTIQAKDTNREGQTRHIISGVEMSKIRNRAAMVDRAWAKMWTEIEDEIPDACGCRDLSGQHGTP